MNWSNYWKWLFQKLKTMPKGRQCVTFWPSASLLYRILTKWCGGKNLCGRRYLLQCLWLPQEATPSSCGSSSVSTTYKIVCLHVQQRSFWYNVILVWTQNRMWGNLRGKKETLSWSFLPVIRFYTFIFYSIFILIFFKFIILYLLKFINYFFIILHYNKK